MESALNPMWVQYGFAGLVFLGMILFVFRVLPEQRRSMEKRDEIFTNTLKDIEASHQNETDRVLKSHESTITNLLGDQSTRLDIVQEIAKNTQETGKTLAMVKQSMDQLYRDPLRHRTRTSDSMRKDLEAFHEQIGTPLEVRERLKELMNGTP